MLRPMAAVWWLMAEVVQGPTAVEVMMVMWRPAVPIVVLRAVVPMWRPVVAAGRAMGAAAWGPVQRPMGVVWGPVRVPVGGPQGGPYGGP